MSTMPPSPAPNAAPTFRETRPHTTSARRVPTQIPQTTLPPERTPTQFPRNAFPAQHARNAFPLNFRGTLSHPTSARRVPIQGHGRAGFPLGARRDSRSAGSIQRQQVEGSKQHNKQKQQAEGSRRQGAKRQSSFRPRANPGLTRRWPEARRIFFVF